MEWSSKQRTSTNKSCQESFKEFMKNLDTKTDKYNRETSKFLCSMPIPHNCPIRGSCLGGINAKCHDGYKGVLCAVCDKGYSRQFNRCIKCPKQFLAVLQFVGYIAFFVIVCLLLSWADKFTNDDTKKRRHWLQEPFIANLQQSAAKEKRTFADIILSTLKILIGFYQVLSCVIDAFSYIPWPHSLKTAIGIFEFLEFEVLRMPSLRCIKTSWHLDAVGEFWFALIAAAVVPTFILVYFAIKASIIHCMSKSKDEFFGRCKTTAKNCLRSAALFCFVTYPVLSRSIVQVLPISCHKLCITKTGGKCEEEISYLRSDYSVKCLDTSMEHKTTLYTAYGALILPFGLPVALLVVLWRLNLNGRKSGRNEESMILMVGSDDDEPLSINREHSTRECIYTEGLVQAAFKFAYENYNSSCWYWEVIEMIRKLIMTIGIVLFLQHTKIGLGGIIVVAMVFTILHAAKNPIKNKFEGFLQLLSLSIIPINLAIGTVLHSKAIGDNDIIEEHQDSLALGLFLVVLNSLLIVLVILRLLRAIAKRVCCSK